MGTAHLKLDKLENECEIREIVEVQCLLCFWIDICLRWTVLKALSEQNQLHLQFSYRTSVAGIAIFLYLHCFKSVAFCTWGWVKNSFPVLRSALHDESKQSWNLSSVCVLAYLTVLCWGSTPTKSRMGRGRRKYGNILLALPAKWSLGVQIFILSRCPVILGTQVIKSTCANFKILPIWFSYVG